MESKQQRHYEMNTKNYIRQLLRESNEHDWSWEEFNSLKSFRDKRQYCYNHLTERGVGTARITFLFSEGKVLKLAKNKKGIAQNKAESKLYKIVDNTHQSLLATIYDSSPSGDWIIMEKISKVNPTEFKKYFGVSLREYIRIVNEDMYEGKKYQGNRRVMKMIDLMHNMEEVYGYAIGDMGRLSSYGKRADGSIVVSDYGLSDNVYDEHYDQEKIQKKKEEKERQEYNKRLKRLEDTKKKMIHNLTNGESVKVRNMFSPIRTSWVTFIPVSVADVVSGDIVFYKHDDKYDVERVSEVNPSKGCLIRKTVYEFNYKTYRNVPKEIEIWTKEILGKVER